MAVLSCPTCDQLIVSAAVQAKVYEHGPSPNFFQLWDIVVKVDDSKTFSDMPVIQDDSPQKSQLVQMYHVIMIIHALVISMK